MMQNQISKKKAWDYVRPAHVEMFGPDIINPEKRARWCQAFLSGGNILSLWNQALELKLTLLSACALKEGQNVMLIGQHADESGIVSALRSLLGEWGEV